MNLLQAIEQAWDNWFRPVEWMGSGDAYYEKVGGTYLTRIRYGSFHMTSSIHYLTGEWEIVTPEQVIAERAK